MTEQPHEQPQGQHQPDQKHEAPGSGQHEKPQGGDGTEHAKPGEKPKTEQASHQGGGHIRTDHTPQGK